MPAPGGIENQDAALLTAMREYRAAMHAKRLGEGSDEDKKYLAEHPNLALMTKILHDVQREIYLKPELASAIAVYRQAMKEQDS